MPRIDRLFVMLCVALALVYACASASQVIDRIQHSSAHVTQHDHVVFSDAVAVVAHGDHHDDDVGGGDVGTGDQPSDHLAGGHHHHGDTGPSLAVDTTEAFGLMALSESLRSSIQDRQIAGVAVPGPERPPRQAAQTA